MNVTIQIPDEVARDLSASSADLSRRALEAFALEEYKNGHLSEPAMRKLLGFATRDQLEGFFKARAVVEDLPIREDIGQELGVARQFEKESGLSVLRTGQPIDAAVVDRTLMAVRDERDLANLGPLP
jgi:hypothetical protein